MRLAVGCDEHIRKDVAEIFRKYETLPMRGAEREITVQRVLPAEECCEDAALRNQRFGGK